MKKTIIFFCLVISLTIVACQDESKQPANISKGGTVVAETANSQPPVIDQNNNDSNTNELIARIQSADPALSENHYINKAIEINLGLPYDHTWLAEWKRKDLPKDNGYAMVYAESENAIVKKYGPLHGSSTFENYSFDLLKNIPGTLIDEGFFIGDYTGSNKNELLSFAETGRGSFLIITGYDKESDKFVDYCNIFYALIDEKKGPAPVVFTKYKGQSGFKITVYLEEYFPVHPPKHKINTYLANYFFAWNPDTRKFEEVEEWDDSVKD